MKIKSLFSILLISLFFSCTSEAETTLDQPTNLEAEERFEIRYGSDDQQVYDIYLPQGRSSKSTKVLLLIHGGSWTGGDKSDMNFFVPILQPNLENYAIANMNYILANDETPAFPNQFEDIQAAINHIKSQATNYNILPEIGIIGFSAGAQLGMYYSYAFDENDDVKMVANVVGPSDFTDAYYSEDPSFQAFFDQLVDDSEYNGSRDEIATQLSPALQVNESSDPTIMFYGDEDPLVPLSQANAINNALEDANIEKSLTIYQGGHGNWDFASYVDLQMKLTRFIKEHL